MLHAPMLRLKRWYNQVAQGSDDDRRCKDLDGETTMAITTVRNKWRSIHDQCLYAAEKWVHGPLFSIKAKLLLKQMQLEHLHKTYHITHPAYEVVILKAYPVVLKASPSCNSVSCRPMQKKLVLSHKHEQFTRLRQHPAQFH